MKIIDRANAFIGHEQEVDEGYETTMRRNAFIAGFKEALGLVKRMREAQKEFESDSPHMDYDKIMEVYRDKFHLESEVDEYLKNMEG